MKNFMFSFTSRICVFGFLFLFTPFISFANTSDELVRDIILINGQAELVEMDHDGEIRQVLLAVPDYFTSNRSHRSQKARSLSIVNYVGSVDLKTCPSILKDHFLNRVVCPISESIESITASNSSSESIISASGISAMAAFSSLGTGLNHISLRQYSTPIITGLINTAMLRLNRITDRWHRHYAATAIDS